MKFIIYCHTNLINQKRYVGWTTIVDGSPHQAMTSRWKDHVSDANRGSRFIFHNAIRKYGLNVWCHEILEVMTTLKSVKHAEILWISELKTQVQLYPKSGYNMTRGGDGVKGYIHTTESRRKNSEAHKGIIKSTIWLERLRISNTGKKRSEQTCENIGRSKRGTNHPFFGKKLSEITRLLIRKNQPNRKIVFQYSKNLEFIALHSSIADAERLTGIPATNIVKCCKHLLKTAGKFIWCYEQENKK